MPKIHAFRGLRYNLAQVGSLSKVVAPPYDVIDDSLHGQLLASSPFNIVRLELPVSQDSVESECESGQVAEAGGPYQLASVLFRQWIRDGVLQHEPDPAIYVYHQTFDYHGCTYTRRGFMSRIDLERFGEGSIYPHEETHAKAKSDRRQLMRACNANMSPIFGLYNDPHNEIQNLLEARVANQAALETEDHLGVAHRIWPIVDQDLIGEVAALIEDKPMFVADGHHRYETACDYRDELAAQAGEALPPSHPACSVLALVMSMDDPGLLVQPTHRLFSGVEAMSSEVLSKRLSGFFECESSGVGSEGAAATWKQICEIDDQGVFGLYTARDDRWTIASVTNRTHAKMAELAPDHSEAWRSLGVSILHNLIVDELLGMRGHSKPKYAHQISEVSAALAAPAGQYPLAALVMPAGVDDIQCVSLELERMPAKSTYFFPKLLSGLVINPLDCS